MTSDRKTTIAFHEAGHAVVARALGRPVALVTIVSTTHSVGSMWAKLPTADAARTTVEEDIRNIADTCARARALMPIGESRLPASAFITNTINRGIELLAGLESERQLNGDYDTDIARADLSEAQLRAAAIAVSPEAAQHYVDLFHAESRLLVNQYWHVVRAVSECLIERQTLTGDEVNLIIAEAEATRAMAEGKARRAAWRETVARAEQFKRSAVRI